MKVTTMSNIYNNEHYSVDVVDHQHYSDTGAPTHNTPIHAVTNVKTGVVEYKDYNLPQALRYADQMNQEMIKFWREKTKKPLDLTDFQVESVN